MNRTGYEHDLRQLLEARGWSERELSRHANVKAHLVTAALAGSGAVPVEALRRLALVLEAEVALRPVQREPRLVGPVETVVDQAVRALERRAVASNLERCSHAAGRRLPQDVDAFISTKRDLLDRLDRFAATPEYLQLQRTVIELEGDGSSDWLCEVLISPALGLGGDLPINLVQQPDGFEMVETYLKRIILNPSGA